MLYGSNEKENTNKGKYNTVEYMMLESKRNWARIQSKRVKPLGSKYLVGLPSGLRIDILSKGSFVSTVILCLSKFAMLRRRSVVCELFFLKKGCW